MPKEDPGTHRNIFHHWYLSSYYTKPLFVCRAYYWQTLCSCSSCDRIFSWEHCPNWYDGWAAEAVCFVTMKEDKWFGLSAVRLPRTTVKSWEQSPPWELLWGRVRRGDLLSAFAQWKIYLWKCIFVTQKVESQSYHVFFHNHFPLVPFS